MLLPLPLADHHSLPTHAAHASSLAQSPTAAPAPPARWSRWGTSPLARVEYGAGSRVPLFADSWIGMERSITGARMPAVSWGGATLDAAIAAARTITAAPVALSFSFRNGRTRTTQVHPAIAILHDARGGAYWLAPLQTTVRYGDEWVDAPHAIDGPAFEGADALLRPPTVLTATRDMVAVVGRSAVLRPAEWTTAPDDSLLDPA